MKTSDALAELAASPPRRRIWPAVSPVLRRRALARMTAIIAPRSRDAPPEEPGLVIAGEMGRASGQGEAARLMARAAEKLGLPTWTVDLPPLGTAVTPPATPVPPRTPLVVHVNAPTLPLALLRLPRALTRDRRIIGYWAWELPDVPPEWRPGLACVDQVWVPSAFSAEALEKLLPGRVRVVPPPLALVRPQGSGATRADFGLPGDAVVVLATCDLAAPLARENPFAAIAAFRAAFAERRDRVLVLRVANPAVEPADFARLADFARAPNILLITAPLSSADDHALTLCSDVVLSLHRSECFGLPLATAMLLGKPVIATGWSGNTDFMTEATAALVGHRMIPVRDGTAVYRGSCWAEPDVEEAVMWLRHLADNPIARHVLGVRGQTAVEARLTEAPLRSALSALGLQLPASGSAGGAAAAPLL